MGDVDKRGKLEEAFFSYRATKDGRVMLYWYDKHVRTLAGDAARKFLADIDGMDETGKNAQLLMAKATGNFKRGNERRA